MKPVPTASEASKYDFIDNISDWNQILLTPNQCNRKTKLLSFQFLVNVLLAGVRKVYLARVIYAIYRHSDKLFLWLPRIKCLLEQSRHTI